LVSFAQALQSNRLSLTRGVTDTLQVNLGLKCNLACKHCHLEAGPMRQELMDRGTMDQVLAYAQRAGFKVIDITGGAPELNPDLPYMVAGAAETAPKVILRSNLTLLTDGSRSGLLELLRGKGVALFVSFPALSPQQLEAQRGKGVFDASLQGLKLLNSLGWGRPEGGLELNLVANPAGAFLPPEQGQAERRFRRELERRWGITFNCLFTLANVPLGRFRAWLERTGNYQSYVAKLAEGFNPCTIDGLMCRSLASVDWDGYLYDCDFNLAAGIPLAGHTTHVSQLKQPPAQGAPIPVSEHCYTCTAGSGFT
jgi:radical SAM/Cys-rich protein